MTVDYFEIDALSNSSLSLLRASPAKFHAVYIAKTLKQEETDAMRLGSAVHMLALEPERFAEQYEILEGPINPSTKNVYGKNSDKFKTWLEEAQAAFKPRKVLLADEFQSSLDIAKAFQSHPEILAVMASNVEKFYEREFYFDVVANNKKKEAAKAKMDCIIPDLGLIIDLKTTQDPSPGKWCWSALDYGYHRQAAFYLDVAEYTFNKPFRFLFGVVRSSKPYETAVYELDHGSVERGRQECQALIDDYVERKEANNWLADWQTGIYPMVLPERKTR